MEWTKQIEEQYLNDLAAQKARLKAGYDQNAAAYQKQIGNAAAQYQQLKNEAYVNNALAERARRENVANLGLSGEGGDITDFTAAEHSNIAEHVGRGIKAATG